MQEIQASRGTNGILECNFLSKTRTAPSFVLTEKSYDANPKRAKGILASEETMEEPVPRQPRKMDKKRKIMMPVMSKVGVKMYAKSILYHTFPLLFLNLFVYPPKNMGDTPMIVSPFNKLVICIVLAYEHSVINAPFTHAVLQCFDIFYGGNGKSSGLLRGMPLVARMFATSEQAWYPMASSSANYCRKTSSVRNGCITVWTLFRCNPNRVV
jgi:hypothetical protein